MVSLALGGDDGQRLRSDARTFANQTATVVQESLLTGQLWGLQLYRTEQGDAEQLHWRWLQWEERGWAVAAPQGLAAGGGFAAGVTAVLTVEGREVTPGRIPSAARQDRSRLQPEIWLAPGDATPFTLALRLKEGGEAAVTLDVLGRVELDIGRD